MRECRCSYTPATELGSTAPSAVPRFEWSLTLGVPSIWMFPRVATSAGGGGILETHTMPDLASVVPAPCFALGNFLVKIWNPRDIFFPEIFPLAPRENLSLGIPNAAQRQSLSIYLKIACRSKSISTHLYLLLLSPYTMSNSLSMVGHQMSRCVFVSCETPEQKDVCCCVTSP